jgi:hypothetical protein
VVAFFNGESCGLVPDFQTTTDWKEGRKEGRKKMSDVLTPNHPRWPEFTELLGGEEGCNFSEDGTRWRCSNESDKPLCLRHHT